MNIERPVLSVRSASMRSSYRQDDFAELEEMGAITLLQIKAVGCSNVLHGKRFVCRVGG